MTDEARGAPRRLPATTDCSPAARDARRARLGEEGHSLEAISGVAPEMAPEALAGSIEGFIGFARIPLGVAGPVRIRGRHADGDFIVPLATTEGTLVASFQHAFNVINRCGGAVAACSRQLVGRAPCFTFADIATAMTIAEWLPTQLPLMQTAAASTSRYCRLQSAKTSLVGNTVYMMLEYSTGDAAGQNMVTLATQAVCQQLLPLMPHTPESWLVESVLSGDKRASAQAFLGARGRNASAEIVLPSRVIGRYWRSDAAGMARTWNQATVGAAQTGAVGLQGNVANALAALFIACGQDVACVSEATTSITRCELTAQSDLYVSVTMPNLIVGTVGGGTFLPTAKESLGMLGCTGPGTAAKFAEICAVVALAGELAIIGAMASGAFAAAHASGGRKGRGTGDA
ncbi:MAG: 3-hydroxy-3-methylglutaryl-CoA reductase [Gammaproteobacteria bacterium]|nr:3-hydroxy-3-methylglutaryl-CoA reductase [Gammaproteobacteria bacterium]